jgi:hypothetical protein
MHRCRETGRPNTLLEIIGPQARAPVAEAERMGKSFMSDKGELPFSIDLSHPERSLFGRRREIPHRVSRCRHTVEIVNPDSSN